MSASLADLVDDVGEWRRRAACAAPNVPVAVFYPVLGRGVRPVYDRAYDDARAVCEGCPVVAQTRRGLEHCEACRTARYGAGSRG